MAIIAKSNGSKKDFPIIEAGSYPARCYSMVHIGTSTENILGTDKVINKVRLTWELPTELIEFKEGEGEQPRAISKDFTLSMHEKSNLRKTLESWRGKGFTEKEAEAFDVTKLIGVPCMLSIIHKPNKAGKVYANISAVVTAPKGMEVGKQINDSFEFNYDPFDADKFNSIPTWIQDRMKLTNEYKAIHELAITEEEESELETNDLPF